MARLKIIKAERSRIPVHAPRDPELTPSPHDRERHGNSVQPWKVSSFGRAAVANDRHARDKSGALFARVDKIC